MTPSQFYALVAILYMAPHMHWSVAVCAFIVFAILSVCSMNRDE